MDYVEKRSVIFVDENDDLPTSLSISTSYKTLQAQIGTYFTFSLAIDFLIPQ